jgi:hypothetical protein
VRLLLCCRLFLWCHRIIILLDGYQHSTVTTHTHTHTHERGARVTCTFYGTSRPRTARERHTHTHTLHQWKRHATTVRSVTTFWQFPFKIFFLFFFVFSPWGIIKNPVLHLNKKNKTPDWIEPPEEFQVRVNTVISLVNAGRPVHNRQINYRHNNNNRSFADVVPPQLFTGLFFSCCCSRRNIDFGTAQSILRVFF